MRTSSALKYLPGLAAGFWLGEWIGSHDWSFAIGGTVMAGFAFVACVVYDLLDTPKAPE